MKCNGKCKINSPEGGERALVVYGGGGGRRGVGEDGCGGVGETESEKALCLRARRRTQATHLTKALRNRRSAARGAGEEELAVLEKYQEGRGARATQQGTRDGWRKT